MRELVVGFCFSKDREKVVLIKKKRPEWQAGLLNGVGGKNVEAYKLAFAWIEAWPEPFRT